MSSARHFGSTLPSELKSCATLSAFLSRHCSVARHLSLAVFLFDPICARNLFQLELYTVYRAGHRLLMIASLAGLPMVGTVRDPSLPYVVGVPFLKSMTLSSSHRRAAAALRAARTNIDATSCWGMGGVGWVVAAATVVTPVGDGRSSTSLALQ